MSNPMTCSKGHFYPATMSKCPFCERDGLSQPTVKTEAIQPVSNAEDDKTRPINAPGKFAQPVSSPPESGDVTIPVSPTGKGVGGSEDERTIIHRPKGGGDTSSRRKLEGWLVSFTMDNAGIDFRLYEGKNVVGRGSDCDIKLIHDPKISAKHALIAFRAEECVFTDEFSTNPSFINGERIGLGDRIPLQDGDRIRMGDHEFIFRKVNP
jgi:hypothetical protein